MRKKVLIISYYWPPAGGPGVQRWMKFAKYFPENGIEPTFFVPDKPNYPVYDYSLNNHIIKDLNIIRHPIFELSSIFRNNKYLNNIRKGNVKNKINQSFFQKMLFFLRGNLFIPDMKIFWRKTSVNFLKKYIIKNSIETIITTGPPHSIHLIGLDLKNKLNIKWIADFRDPWLKLNYLQRFHLLKYTKKIHKKYRDDVLNNADAIITTSKKLKIYFDTISKNNFKVTNGYDYFRKDIKLDKQFSISHVGSIYPDRNPKILWLAIEKLCINISGFINDLKLNFVGNVDQEFKNNLKSKIFAKCINYCGYVDYENTIDYVCRSQLLLMIEVNDIESSYAVPGKFYDYLNSNRPILAIGPNNSEVSSILNKTNTGDFYNYKELDLVYNYILESYNKFKMGSNIISPINLEKYSRKELTKDMVKIINSL